MVISYFDRLPSNCSYSPQESPSPKGLGCSVRMDNGALARSAKAALGAMTGSGQPHVQSEFAVVGKTARWFARKRACRFSACLEQSPSRLLQWRECGGE
jgi:hypothetical protein